MSSSNEMYEFYFKLAYTNQTIIYSVSSNTTITDFIQEVSVRARNDFNIPLDDDVEIVEASQFDTQYKNISNIIPDASETIPDANEEEMTDTDLIIHIQTSNANRRDAEMAPYLKCSDKTLKQMYANCHKTTAFYIRTNRTRNVLSIIMPDTIDRHESNVVTPTISRQHSA